MRCGVKRTLLKCNKQECLTFFSSIFFFGVNNRVLIKLFFFSPMQVISLVGKLTDLAKLESLDAERRKEIDDLLSSTNVIPKAPWDEGVCKVCGVDRDDDSVLLCDTCDAEYHTYCLNPPLARIPEGNWYCPSCVVGKRIQDMPQNVQVIRQRSRKKYLGEVTRVYLEALSNLAGKMEEKEYWEFTVDEVWLLIPIESFSYL